MRENFAFAWCERRQTLSYFIQFGAALSTNAIFFERGGNGSQQVFVIHRLGEEIQSTSLHGLHAHRDIATSCKKNNRNRAAFRLQRPLQFKSVQAGHCKIEHKTTWSARVV